MEDIYKEADKILKYIIENKEIAFKPGQDAKIIYENVLGKDINELINQHKDKLKKILDRNKSYALEIFLKDLIIKYLEPLLIIMVDKGLIKEEKNTYYVYTKTNSIYNFYYSGGFKAEIEAKQLQEENIKASIAVAKSQLITDKRTIEIAESQKNTNRITVFIAALTFIALVVQIWLSLRS